MATGKKRLQRTEITQVFDYPDSRTDRLLEHLGIDPNTVEVGPGIRVSYTLIALVEDD